MRTLECKPCRLAQGNPWLLRSRAGVDLVRALSTCMVAIAALAVYDIST